MFRTVQTKEGKSPPKQDSSSHKLFRKREIVCSKCQQVDWQDLVKRPVDPNFTRTEPFLKDDKHLQGRFVRMLDKVVDMRLSNCPSCQVLSNLELGLEILKHYENSSTAKGHIFRRLEVTTLGSRVQLLPDQDGPALLRLSLQDKEHEGVYHQGRRYVALLDTKKHTEAVMIPLHIEDFTWVQKAISTCSRFHKNCDKKGSQVVPGLQVIDCSLSAGPERCAVVPAPPSCQYATLSYVWGEKVRSSPDKPVVVKDAIDVTIKLGLRYLWVDRYCIPQDGPEKLRQIRSMNEVFSKSYITIVAAAGRKASYGLSGVQSASRNGQMRTEVKGCTFLEIPSISDAVWRSTWATRAWTLQEGLLSKRCLVFTDSGLLYRCRDLYIEEPLQQLAPANTIAPMDAHDPMTKWDLERLFTADDPYHQNRQSLANPQNRGPFDHLNRRIVQYTQRELSWVEDSLNAFLGVFTDFEQSSSSKQRDYSSIPMHLWGLPIDSFGPLLEWYHPKPPKSRRLDFPSWSWCGWEGGIQFANDALSPRFSSRIETYDPVAWEYPGTQTNSHNDRTKILHLTGPIVPLKLAEPKQFSSKQRKIDDIMKRMPANREELVSRLPSVFALFPGTFTIIRSYLSTEINTKDNIFGLLLFVRHHRSERSATNPNCLKYIILLKKGSGSYSKVGFISVEDVWNCQHIDTKGASVDKKIFGQSGLLNFGQETVRQRICLE